MDEDPLHGWSPPPRTSESVAFINVDPTGRVCEVCSASGGEGGVVYSSLVFVDSFNLVVETLFSVIFDEVFTNGVTLQRSRNTQNELFFCKSGETPEWIDNDESYEVIITPYKVTFVQSIYEDVGCSDLIGDYNDNISNSTAWPELTVNFSTFNLQTINF